MQTRLLEIYEDDVRSVCSLSFLAFTSLFSPADNQRIGLPSLCVLVIYSNMYLCDKPMISGALEQIFGVAWAHTYTQ